jgi:propanol-preferring alcohol dehydrogenase
MDATPSMRAMVWQAAGQALQMEERPVPEPGPGQLRLRVLACAVCRTDVHLIDGELPFARPPVVPGHEIVGRIEALGPLVQAGVGGWRLGQRVGVPWLGHTCGHCDYCAAGQENLCDHPGWTGCTRDGGFATHVLAEADYVFDLDDLPLDDVHAAPLLCAGLIGYRAYRRAGRGQRLGLYGFGAAAHLLVQLARSEGWQVYAFTRAGDTAAQAHARRLGAVWAGASEEPPPHLLDAAILFAPVGALVPLALRAVRKGGRVVCAGIQMSDIPGFPYRDLWQERQLVSVANLTRADGQAYLRAVRQTPPQVHVQVYPLAQANEALADLRAGRVLGAAVLRP